MTRKPSLIAWNLSVLTPATTNAFQPENQFPFLGNVKKEIQAKSPGDLLHLKITMSSESAVKSFDNKILSFINNFSVR